jgi:hypothetical protein
VDNDLEKRLLRSDIQWILDSAMLPCGIDVYEIGIYMSHKKEKNGDIMRVVDFIYDKKDREEQFDIQWDEDGNFIEWPTILNNDGCFFTPE